MNRIVSSAGACVLAVCMLVAGGPAEEPAVGGRSAAPPRDEALELVVLGDASMARLRVQVEVDGRPLSAIWAETFDQLFAFHDRDGDGRLDERQARRLPSPFGLRQVLWGVFPSSPSTDQAQSVRDQDGDGHVSPDEMVESFRRAGLGSPVVGFGKPAMTEALTVALLDHLDTDRDGAVTDREWKDAADSLRKMDRNDDELIGAGELCAKVVYPGASATSLLSPPSSSESSGAEEDGWPLVWIPLRTSDERWAEVIVRRRDRNRDGRLDADESGLGAGLLARLDANDDGRLTSAELAGWRASEPDAVWRIRLSGRKTEPVTVESLDQQDRRASPPNFQVLDAGRIHLELRGTEGRLPGVVEISRKYFDAWFVAEDGDRDGLLVLEESTAGGPGPISLASLIEAADRDEDGRLSRRELGRWLDLQEQIARGQVLLAVIDHGAGLFELLDVDRDGALSVRELRGAWDRLTSTGCVTGSRIDRAKLPVQLLATASRGHSIAVPSLVRPEGPAWFRAMDRNGDGDLSRREFMGPVEEFRKRDDDGDGLISPGEAVPRPSRTPAR